MHINTSLPISPTSNISNIQQHSQTMRPIKYRKDKTPLFIGKLYQILTKQENKNIINWTQQQNSFVIYDVSQFTFFILPKYFKHCNYNSFVRQLNIYNFHKIRYTIQSLDMEHVYYHRLFFKGNLDNLKLIRRKQTATRCQSLMLYKKKPQKYSEQSALEHQQKVFDLKTKLRQVKQKQQQLQDYCIKLIHQNQILTTQNQQLSHRIKKQSKKKQKILEQVFRIIGVSITECWDQFCQDTDTMDQKTTHFQQIYQILMNFIQQNDLFNIFKTLQFFISPNQKKKKIKTFRVLNPKQQQNFISSYTDQQIQQFIQNTNVILENKNFQS